MDIHITRPGTESLEVKAKPETLLTIFIVVWFAGFGGMPLSIFPVMAYEVLYNLGTKTLSCQRDNQKVTCQTKDNKFLGLAQPVVTTLPPIKSAKLDYSKTPKRQRENWVTLVTNKNESIPVFASEWNPRGFTGDIETVESRVSQINTFLNSQQSSFTLVYPTSQQLGGLWALGFLSLFPVLGLIIVFCIFQSHTLTFDRRNQTITHHHSTLLGSKTYTYSLKSVQGLEIRKKRGNKGSIYYETQWIADPLTRLPRLNSSNYESLHSATRQMGEFLSVLVHDYSGRFS